MPKERSGHTATLLKDGRVLILGGGSDTPTAEIYDPATGKFTSTGSLAGPHMFGTATLLADGRVLVTGGEGLCDNTKTQNQCPIIATSELYDPTTGTFSATGSMKQARYSQTAALLPDGRLLIAGGVASNGQSVGSAELYDPKTGKFSPTDAMPVAGDGAATRLSDGRVLVLALEGTGPDPKTSVAETYDPKAGKWSKRGTFASAGYAEATLLKDGRVLVAGGAASLMGNQDAVASAWLFDPGTGKFTPTGSMTVARLGYAATLLADGRVLIAGGAGSKNLGSAIPTPIASADIYAPASGTFSATGPMTSPREGHTATLLLNGTVLIVGGGATASFAEVNSAELFVP